MVAPRVLRNRLVNRFGEPALTVGTAIASEPINILAGLLQLDDSGVVQGNRLLELFGLEPYEGPATPSQALRRMEEVAERFTYSPRSPEGQAGLQSLKDAVVKVMNAVGVDEAITSFNETVVPKLNQAFGEEATKEIGSAILMSTPFVKKVPDLIDPDKDMMFLHNTSPEAIKSFDEIGGVPMPSLAVTRAEIPFDSFGEITLVGKPESFDPRATSTNDLFSADAYTVRGPRPMQLAKKNADDIFEKKYGTAEELNEELDIYASDIPFELSEQSVKSRANTTSFNRIKDFFLRPDARKLFALDQGYDKNKLPKRDDSVEVKGKKQQELEMFLIGKDEALSEWRTNQIADLFEPEKVFVSKVQSETDYKPRRQTVAPFTAETVTKFMRRSSGPNQEGGFAKSSVGAQRAATAERIKSLKQAKERKDQLQSKESLDKLKDTQNDAFFAIANDLEKNYKYQGENRFTYLDDVGDVIKLSERMGLPRAFETVGFENVSDELVDAINEYKDSLRSAPTQYFESKPRRTVSLSEFGGAIVPEGTEPKIKQILEKHGITNIQTYTPGTTERLEARKAFQELMFSVGLPASVAATIIYGQQEDNSV